MSFKDQIKKGQVPKHVAIIMDGNGRWAKSKGKFRVFGHQSGVKAVRDTVEGAAEIGLKYITLYAFSTENWKRPKKEVNYLFNLLEVFLTKKTNQLNKNGIKFKMIGSKTNFSKRLNKILINSEKKTINNKNLQINLALNYGSKSELIKAIKLIKRKKINFSISNLDKHLYTANIPDPDLLIRTGNTKRLSNFMLWQLAYSEIYFEKKLWPDFTTKDYNKILYNFKKTKRNFGKI